MFTLFNCAKTKETRSSGISLPIPMSNTHSTTDRDVKPFQLAILTNNRDEAYIICENVYIICGWDSNSDLELYNELVYAMMDECSETHLAG